MYAESVKGLWVLNFNQYTSDCDLGGFQKILVETLI